MHLLFQNWFSFALGTAFANLNPIWICWYLYISLSVVSSLISSLIRNDIIENSYIKIRTARHLTCQCSCADPESFVRGVKIWHFFLFYIILLFYFFLAHKGRDDPNTTKSGPSSVRQRNGIDLKLNFAAYTYIGNTRVFGLMLLFFVSSVWFRGCGLYITYTPKYKWVWPGNNKITDHRPTHSTTRKRYQTPTATRQQSWQNQSKTTGLSLFLSLSAR